MNFIYNFDNGVLDFIQSHMRCAALDAVFPFITRLGDFGFIWIVTALVLIFTKKYRAAGVTVLVALALGVLIGNFGIKPLIARPRPCDVNIGISLLIPRPADYSFPSAHTMSSFAAATVIFMRDRRLGIGAFALGTVIAFSRLYLYVHYPTDILCGAVIGVIFGIAAGFYSRRGQ